jgi:3-oxoacyl-[acyl-carrier-protein] synthase I
MNEAYLAGRGLACALGLDLDAALVALGQGGVAPSRFEIAGGSAWPLYTIADFDADRSARARRIIERVAAQSGALAGGRSGPLFVASSSLGIGELEDSGDFGGSFGGDYQTFAETVAAWLDWRGPVYSVCTACTSGLNALLSARTLIRNGQADHVLVLGVELRNRVSVSGFAGMQLLSATRALPFGAARDGLVLGEAVAALHVSAQPSRWRLAGGANVVDGHDPAGCVPSAVIAMCREALHSGALEPRDIALIKPQAAGSPVNDAAEVRALRQVFDPLPALVPLKAAIGHTLGAAGAAEVALLMACLETGIWPRFDYAQDSSLDGPLADHAPPHARHVLASILGFGGGHAAVVLEDRDA